MNKFSYYSLLRVVYWQFVYLKMASRKGRPARTHFEDLKRICAFAGVFPTNVEEMSRPGKASANQRGK